MKDHARQVPGSTRSRRPAVSFRATPSWRFPIIPKSTYKMQTKCIQNRKCYFFNGYVRVTYEFNTLKCLHFPDRRSVGMSLRRRPRVAGGQPCGAGYFRPASPLPWGEGMQGEGQTGTSYPLVMPGNKLTNTVQNRTQPNDFRFRSISTPLYQRLTTTPHQVVRFFTRGPAFGVGIHLKI